VDLAAEWAQQILVIKDGRTLAQGDVSILADEKIAGEAGLRFPVVTQIFKHIPELKLAAVPLRISDAVSEIRKVLKETGRDR